MPIVQIKSECYIRARVFIIRLCSTLRIHLYPIKYQVLNIRINRNNNYIHDTFWKHIVKL